MSEAGSHCHAACLRPELIGFKLLAYQQLKRRREKVGLIAPDFQRARTLVMSLEEKK